MPQKKSKLDCCPSKPDLGSRPLLGGLQAHALESTFKMLANATRLRMLHALVRAGELCVGDLAETLKMTPQAVSNQLQRLSGRGIVESRRNGLQIHYRIVDPCVVSLLDQGWCLTDDAATRRHEEAKSGRVAS